MASTAPGYCHRRDQHQLKAVDTLSGHGPGLPVTFANIAVVMVKYGKQTSQQIFVKDKSQDSPPPTTQLMVKNAAEDGTPT